jgi:hypothetical protein
MDVENKTGIATARCGSALEMRGAALAPTRDRSDSKSATGRVDIANPVTLMNELATQFAAPPVRSPDVIVQIAELGGAP